MHLQTGLHRPQWVASRSMCFMRGGLLRDLRPDPEPSSPFSAAVAARTGTEDQVPFIFMPA
jgi:hypothetical protein